MPRTDLTVPFAEKDDAKRLGARWDAATKNWYVPEGLAVHDFARWLPPLPRITVRGDSYFIAQTTTRCWKCRDATMVFGIILPAGHQTLEGNDDGGSRWLRHGGPGFVYYLTDLSAPVAARLASVSPTYRLDFSKTTSSSYWMNHCAHCGMKQGDFGMYCEPGGAFMPMTPEDAGDIRVQHVQASFACAGEVSWGDHLFTLTQSGAGERSPSLSPAQQPSEVAAMAALKRWVTGLF